MRKRSPVGVLATMLALAQLLGCERSVTWRVVDTPASSTWTGATLFAVVGVWGPCAAPQPDGNGGTICIYSSHTPTRIDSGNAMTVDSTGRTHTPGDAIPKASSGIGAQNDVPLDAKFWLDAGGKVYRYWFSDSTWKSHAEKTKPAR